MSWQSDFINILKKEFARRKQKNPSYSLRSFANNIGMPPGPLSELLSGSRVWNFSPEWASKFLSRIQLDDAVKKKLELKMGKAPSQSEKNIAVGEDGHRLFSNWYYFPILMSYDLPEQFRNSQFISSYLGIAIETVEEAIEYLIDQGHLEKHEDGKIVRPRQLLRSQDNINNETISAFHHHCLEKSHQALGHLPVEKRDFQYMTFVGSPNGFKVLKEEIAKLLDRASILADDGPNNSEVFQLSVQYFPLRASEFENK